MPRFVVLLATLAACRCAPSPMPVPYTRANGPQVVLSVVRPDGPGCVWERREDPSARRVTLARLPAPCDAVRLAWSPDGTRGLVELGRGEGWALFLSRLDGADATALPGPPGGTLDDFGFDAAGALRATTVGPSGDAKVAADEVEGVPALVHAWTWDGAAWREDEAKVVGLDEDGDRTDGFEWEAALGPRTFTDDALPDDDDASWVRDDALAERFDEAIEKDRGGGRWQRLATKAAIYQFVSDDFGQAKALVLDEPAGARSLLSTTDPRQPLRVEASVDAIVATPEGTGPFVLSGATGAGVREFVPEATVHLFPSRGRP